MVGVFQTTIIITTHLVTTEQIVLLVQYGRCLKEQKVIVKSILVPCGWFFLCYSVPVAAFSTVYFYYFYYSLPKLLTIDNP